MAKLRMITIPEVLEAARDCATRIVRKGWTNGNVRLFGVPRGGIPAAAFVAHELGDGARVVGDPLQAEVFIDDLIDSGATRDRYRGQHPGRPFEALFTKIDTDEWLVFPWEGTIAASAEDIPVRLLQFIGEDPEREGLKETPARFLAAWTEWTQGYRSEPDLKAFADGADKYDELVLVKDIPIYSHCEHHLTPFHGVAHIAYLPNGKIIGLSKLARLAQVYAQRLQVQERLTQQIAHALQSALEPVGVGVVLECRHLCMESRGVRVPGSSTTTSCLLGALKEKPEARAEFMRLVR
jgi:GTP cyclohydrolase IA